MKVLLIGGSGGSRALAAITASCHRIVGVVDTDPAFSSGMSLGNIAVNQGLFTWPREAVKDPTFPDAVRRQDVDVVLSVRSPYLLPAPLLEAPRYGSYNLHFGPLPDYAGRNAVSWAIYNGEDRHGVTLHRMTPEVDRGGIVSAVHFPITDADTARTVTQRCLTEGLRLLVAMLDEIAAASAAARTVEQPSTGGRYYTNRDRPEMMLAWHRPSREFLRLARACSFHPFPSPWGLPRTVLAGRMLDILRLGPGPPVLAGGIPGSVLEVSDGGAVVATGDRPVVLESFLIDGRVRDAAEIVRVGDRFDPLK